MIISKIDERMQKNVITFKIKLCYDFSNKINFVINSLLLYLREE